MILYLERKRHSLAYRLICAFVAFTFAFSLISPTAVVYAQTAPTILNLPAPGAMLPVSPGFTPAVIKGLKIHPENPLQFDFIVNTGDMQLNDEEFEQEAQRLVKYFLASLTVPEDQMWVNLSPYEKDRIIPEGFGVTEMGRDLLSQDYLLKQLTASLIYPEDELGKKFWDKVHKKARALYGTTDIPINTFNKVWIVPDKAVVWENDGTAFVVKSHLKVMMEQDYISLKNNLNSNAYGTVQLEDKDVKDVSSVSSEIVREILIPEIEKEVNEGATFANLRQIYNSMILATWYKNTLKQSLLGQVYVDQNKVKGVDVADKEVKQKIYDQYLAAFKKGVYNYIKEDYDPTTQQMIPRKYFSGGFTSEGIGAEVDAAMVSSSFEDLPRDIQQLVVERHEASRSVTVVLAEREDESRLVPAFWRRWQGESRERESLTAFLEAIENGEEPVNFADPTALKSIIDRLLESHRVLGDSVLSGILARYEDILSSNDTSPEVIQRIDNLSFLVEEIYFAVSPREALNVAEDFPIELAYENGLPAELGNRVASAMTSPQARDNIRAALRGLFYEGDMYFSDDIEVTVVERMYVDGPPKVEFNQEQRRVLIDSDISPEALVPALRVALQQARLHQISRELTRGLSLEDASEIEDRLQTLYTYSQSFIPLLIYYNASVSTSFENTIALLDGMISGDLSSYGSLVSLIENQRIALELEREERADRGPSILGRAAGATFRFLRENPAVVVVPLMVLAGAAAAIADVPDDLSGATGGLELADGGAGGLEYYEEFFERGRALSRNTSQGDMVSDLIPRMAEFTDAQDIAGLSGQTNTQTGQTYNDWLSQNAEEIYEGAQSDAEEGNFTTDVESFVIAFQNDNELVEDGDIGPEVIRKLRELEDEKTQEQIRQARASDRSAMERYRSQLAGADTVEDVPSVPDLNNPVNERQLEQERATRASYLEKRAEAASEISRLERRLRELEDDQRQRDADIPRMQREIDDLNERASELRRKKRRVPLQEEAAKLQEGLDKVKAARERIQSSLEETREELERLRTQVEDSEPGEGPARAEPEVTGDERVAARAPTTVDTELGQHEQDFERQAAEEEAAEQAREQAAQDTRAGIVQSFLDLSSEEVDERYVLRHYGPSNEPSSSLEYKRGQFERFLDQADEKHRPVIEEGLRRLDEEEARMQAEEEAAQIESERLAAEQANMDAARDLESQLAGREVGDDYEAARRYAESLREGVAGYDEEAQAVAVGAIEDYEARIAAEEEAAASEAPQAPDEEADQADSGESEFQRIVSSLQSPDQETALAALEQLGQLDAEGVDPASLLDILRGDAPNIVRAHLGRMLVEDYGQGEAVVEIMLGDLSDPASDADTRALAVTILGHVVDADGTAIPHLIAALSDDDAEVREAAATALGHQSDAAFSLGLGEAIGYPQVIEPLINALEDESPWVRKEATIALSIIARHDSSALVPLLRAMGDTESEFRSQEAGLAAVGFWLEDGIPGIVSALDELLYHSDEVVRQGANELLQAISENDDHPEQEQARIILEELERAEQDRQQLETERANMEEAESLASQLTGREVGNDFEEERRYTEWLRQGVARYTEAARVVAIDAIAGYEERIAAAEGAEREGIESFRGALEEAETSEAAAGVTIPGSVKTDSVRAGLTAERGERVNELRSAEAEQAADEAEGVATATFRSSLAEATTSQAAAGLEIPGDVQDEELRGTLADEQAARVAQLEGQEDAQATETFRSELEAAEGSAAIAGVAVPDLHDEDLQRTLDEERASALEEAQAQELRVEQERAGIESFREALTRTESSEAAAGVAIPDTVTTESVRTGLIVERGERVEALRGLEAEQAADEAEGVATVTFRSSLAEATTSQTAAGLEISGDVQDEGLRGTLADEQAARVAQLEGQEDAQATGTFRSELEAAEGSAAIAGVAVPDLHDEDLQRTLDEERASALEEAQAQELRVEQERAGIESFREALIRAESSEAAAGVAIPETVTTESVRAGLIGERGQRVEDLRNAEVEQAADEAEGVATATFRSSLAEATTSQAAAGLEIPGDVQDEGLRGTLAGEQAARVSELEGQEDAEATGTFRSELEAVEGSAAIAGVAVPDLHDEDLQRALEGERTSALEEAQAQELRVSEEAAAGEESQPASTEEGREGGKKKKKGNIFTRGWKSATGAISDVVSDGTDRVEELRDVRARKRLFRDQLDAAETVEEAQAVEVPNLDSRRERQKLQQEREERITEIREEQERVAAGEDEEVVKKKKKKGPSDDTLVRVFRDDLEKATTADDARAVTVPDLDSSKRKGRLERERAERIAELAAPAIDATGAVSEDGAEGEDGPPAFSYMQPGDALDTSTATVFDLKELMDREEGKTVKIIVLMVDESGIGHHPQRVVGTVIKVEKAIAGGYARKNPPFRIIFTVDATGEQVTMGRKSKYWGPLGHPVSKRAILAEVGVQRVFIEGEEAAAEAEVIPEPGPAVGQPVEAPRDQKISDAINAIRMPGNLALDVLRLRQRAQFYEAEETMAALDTLVDLGLDGYRFTERQFDILVFALRNAPDEVRVRVAEILSTIDLSVQSSEIQEAYRALAAGKTPKGKTIKDLPPEILELLGRPLAAERATQRAAEDRLAAGYRAALGGLTSSDDIRGLELPRVRAELAAELERERDAALQTVQRAEQAEARRLEEARQREEARRLEEERQRAAELEVQQREEADRERAAAEARQREEAREQAAAQEREVEENRQQAEANLGQGFTGWMAGMMNSTVPEDLYNDLQAESSQMLRGSYGDFVSRSNSQEDMSALRLGLELAGSDIPDVVRDQGWTNIDFFVVMDFPENLSSLAGRAIRYGEFNVVFLNRSSFSERPEGVSLAQHIARVMGHEGEHVLQHEEGDPFVADDRPASIQKEKEAYTREAAISRRLGYAESYVNVREWLADKIGKDDDVSRYVTPQYDTPADVIAIAKRVEERMKRVAEGAVEKENIPRAQRITDQIRGIRVTSQTNLSEADGRLRELIEELNAEALPDTPGISQLVDSTIEGKTSEISAEEMRRARAWAVQMRALSPQNAQTADEFNRMVGEFNRLAKRWDGVPFVNQEALDLIEEVQTEVSDAISAAGRAYESRAEAASQQQMEQVRSWVGETEELSPEDASNADELNEIIGEFNRLAQRWNGVSFTSQEAIDIIERTIEKVKGEIDQAARRLRLSQSDSAMVGGIDLISDDLTLVIKIEPSAPSFLGKAGTFLASLPAPSITTFYRVRGTDETIRSIAESRGIDPEELRRQNRSSGFGVDDTLPRRVVLAFVSTEVVFSPEDMISPDFRERRTIDPYDTQYFELAVIDKVGVSLMDEGPENIGTVVVIREGDYLEIITDDGQYFRIAGARRITIQNASFPAGFVIGRTNEGFEITNLADGSIEVQVSSASSDSDAAMTAGLTGRESMEELKDRNVALGGLSIDETNPSSSVYQAWFNRISRAIHERQDALSNVPVKRRIESYLRSDYLRKLGASATVIDQSVQDVSELLARYLGDQSEDKTLLISVGAGTGVVEEEIARQNEGKGFYVIAVDEWNINEDMEVAPGEFVEDYVPAASAYEKGTLGIQNSDLMKVAAARAKTDFVLNVLDLLNERDEKQRGSVEILFNNPDQEIDRDFIVLVKEFGLAEKLKPKDRIAIKFTGESEIGYVTLISDVFNGERQIDVEGRNAYVRYGVDLWEKSAWSNILSLKGFLYVLKSKTITDAAMVADGIRSLEGETLGDVAQRHLQTVFAGGGWSMSPITADTTNGQLLKPDTLVTVGSGLAPAEIDSAVRSIEISAYQPRTDLRIFRFSVSRESLVEGSAAVVGDFAEQLREAALEAGFTGEDRRLSYKTSAFAGTNVEWTISFGDDAVNLESYWSSGQGQYERTSISLSSDPITLQLSGTGIERQTVPIQTLHGVLVSPSGIFLVQNPTDSGLAPLLRGYGIKLISPTDRQTQIPNARLIETPMSSEGEAETDAAMMAAPDSVDSLVEVYLNEGVERFLEELRSVTGDNPSLASFYRDIKIFLNVMERSPYLAGRNEDAAKRIAQLLQIMLRTQTVEMRSVLMGEAVGRALVASLNRPFAWDDIVEIRRVDDMREVTAVSPKQALGGIDFETLEIIGTLFKPLRFNDNFYGFGGVGTAFFDRGPEFSVSEDDVHPFLGDSIRVEQVLDFDIPPLVFRDFQDFASSEQLIDVRSVAPDLRALYQEIMEEHDRQLRELDEIDQANRKPWESSPATLSAFVALILMLALILATPLNIGDPLPLNLQVDPLETHATHLVSQGEYPSMLSFLFYGDTHDTRIFTANGQPVPVDWNDAYMPFLPGEVKLLPDAMVLSYEVQPNDTLGDIARRVYGDTSLYRRIAWYNQIEEDATLFPGDALKIPTHVDEVRMSFRRNGRLPRGTRDAYWHYHPGGSWTGTLLLSRSELQLRFEMEIEAERDNAMVGSVRDRSPMSRADIEERIRELTEKGDLAIGSPFSLDTYQDQFVVRPSLVLGGERYFSDIVGFTIYENVLYVAHIDSSTGESIVVFERLTENFYSERVRTVSEAELPETVREEFGLPPSSDAAMVAEDNVTTSEPAIMTATITSTELFPDDFSEPTYSGDGDVGGIDFNATLLNLEIKRDGNGVPLPMPQQTIENINIEGFFPVIINVTPINLPLILGAVMDEDGRIVDSAEPVDLPQSPSSDSAKGIPVDRDDYFVKNERYISG